ncbi:hypothetical protein QCA50_001262 [Cerrena zonata]|uniref:Uncharacterized protein n=1 Tax=Cerrena zonata TaxID=2478898 RepID=A0AAW0GYF7_9APHY
MSEDETQPVVNKNKRHRKEKPWDTDDIDHGKLMNSNPRITKAEPSLKSPRSLHYSPSTEKSIFEKCGVR